MLYRKVGGRMKDYIEKRAVELAQYIVENNATVRKTAKIFNISKSTVHTVVSIRVGYVGWLIIWQINKRGGLICQSIMKWNPKI